MFNGIGQYNTLTPPVFPAVPGTTIQADYFNQIINDLAQALSICLTRDGQAPMTQPLQMGGKKITGLAQGTADDEAVTKLQLTNAVGSFAAKDLGDLRTYGGKADGSDSSAALTLALAAGAETIRFSYLPGESDQVYFSAFNPTDLIGKTIDFDSRLTVSLPDNSLTAVFNSTGIRVDSPLRLYFRSLLSNYVLTGKGEEIWSRFGEQEVLPSIGEEQIEQMNMIRWDTTGAAFQKISWNSSDTWTDVTPSGAGATGFVLPIPNDGTLNSSFLRVEPGDFIQAALSVTGTPLILVMVRHSGGYAGIWTNANYSGTPTEFGKVTGSAGVSAGLTPVGPGTHESYSGLGSTWGLKILSWDTFAVTWNGVEVARRTVTGVIQEAGFGGYGTGAGQAVVCSNPCLYTGGSYFPGRLISIAQFGDSKTAVRAGAWPTLLRGILDGSLGMRVWKSDNLAVAGQAVSQQRSAMAAADLSPYSDIYISLGTNDGQGNTDLTAFATDMAWMMDKALESGRRLIVGLPYPWYTQGQAGAGKGQASTNYGRLAPYRGIIQGLAADRWSTGRVRVVDEAALHGPVLANYVNSSLSPNLVGQGNPVVYDNIHPTEPTNLRMARAYAKAHLSFFGGWKTPIYFPPTVVGAGQNNWVTTTQPPICSVDSAGKVSWTGIIDAGAGAVRTNGTVIFRIPKGLAPRAVMRIRPACATFGEAVILQIDSSGDVAVYGATTSSWISLDGVGYQIASRGKV